MSVRTCDVDGCKALVTLELYGDEWIVSHGAGEAVRHYDWRTLFVTTGYQKWVRDVHAYESGDGVAKRP